MIQHRGLLLNVYGGRALYHLLVWAFTWVDENGIGPAILVYLMWVAAQWWLPPLCWIAGLGFIGLAVFDFTSVRNRKQARKNE